MRTEALLPSTPILAPARCTVSFTKLAERASFHANVMVPVPCLKYLPMIQLALWEPSKNSNDNRLPKFSSSNLFTPSCPSASLFLVYQLSLPAAVFCARMRLSCCCLCLEAPTFPSLLGACPPFHHDFQFRRSPVIVLYHVMLKGGPREFYLVEDSGFIDHCHVHC